MKTIKQYIEDKKEKLRLKDEANQKSSFKVKERGGFLWLTYNGVAFKKMEPSASAADIVKALNTARDYSVEFGRL